LGGRCSKDFDPANPPLTDPTDSPSDNFPSSVISLSPKPLPIYNQSTLLPSVSLHSNVTIRRKPRARLLKSPLVATEGGLASFGDLDPFLLDADHPQTPSLHGSLVNGHVLTSSSTLRASLLSL
jgi:hypothetical protein